MTKYARRVDTNHSAIIGELRQVPGLTVFDLSAMGNGCSDIVVGWRARNWLFEIKAPKKRKHLSPAQRRFRDAWTGQYDVIETAHEALRIVGAELPHVPFERGTAPPMTK